ncbi:MAG: epoxyqueuosine reductase [Clostridia bacterium]|nr:epoxyqueuosine reductase [Clostridia bacterium]
MDERIAALLGANGIEYAGAIPMDAALIINKRIYDQNIAGFAKNVITFLVPYRAEAAANRNLSIYAVPRDYHLFMKDLFERLEPELEKLYRGSRFKGMSDHSPIDETLAAAKCGLGAIGENRRLINEKYGSYVFIGEFYTDAEIGVSPPCEPKKCLGCGKCRKACPTGFSGECLSAVTQKKGELTEDEKELVKRCDSVWGCDVCQYVCPMNAGKEFTRIDFFRKELIYRLDPDKLSAMTPDEFEKRAYSWRGRAVIERNVRIICEPPSASSIL